MPLVSRLCVRWSAKVSNWVKKVDSDKSDSVQSERNTVSVQSAHANTDRKAARGNSWSILYDISADCHCGTRVTRFESVCDRRCAVVILVKRVKDGSQYV